MSNAQDPTEPRAVFVPPRVNAVGVVEYADDHGGTPRQFGAAQRWVAWAFLVFFFAATVVTTVISLGAYCLTSDGADTRQLHASPLMEQNQAFSASESTTEPLSGEP